MSCQSDLSWFFLFPSLQYSKRLQVGGQNFSTWLVQWSNTTWAKKGTLMHEKIDQGCVQIDSLESEQFDLQDLKRSFPALANGLQQLLDFDGDVATTFVQNFEVEYDYFGELRKHSLKEGGANIQLTNDNREEYVRLYTHWKLHDSISKQFNAFAEGFREVSTCLGRDQSLAHLLDPVHGLQASVTSNSCICFDKCMGLPVPKQLFLLTPPPSFSPTQLTSSTPKLRCIALVQVCDGPALQMFRSDELELLICGLPELNFEHLESVARYDGGYNQEHPSIKALWHCLHSLSFDQKKLFLKFTTGCDR